MSISQLYPEEGPTLNLNFAGSRTLDPRITFSRSQTTSNGSTYMGRDGLIKYAGPDEPRFDHRYVNGEVESLGLLIEESRTNSATYSNDLSTWGSVYSQTLTQDVVGPDGIVNSAWTFDDTYTGGDGAFREKSFSVTPSTNQYCFSIFAKRGTAIWFDMYAFFVGSSTRAVYLNYVWATNTLTVGSAENSPPVPTVYGRIEYPNGWYRFYFVFSDPTGLNSACLFRLYPSSRNAGYVGSTLFYGAQVEQGSFPTSYIPTEGSTKTRNSDRAFITGTNFTEWYNANEGTLFARAKSFAVSSQLTGVAALNVPTDGTKRVDIRYNQGGNSYVGFNASPGLVIARTSGYSLSDPKFIVGYKTNIQKFAVNASLGSATATFTPASDITHLQIGTFDNFSYHLCGHISQLSYYPFLLTDNQLTTLTR